MARTLIPEQRERKRAYYQANKEKILAQQREYREAHREQQREYNRAYYEANREGLLARQRAYERDTREHNRRYYQANREKILAKGRAYRAANRDKVRAWGLANKHGGMRPEDWAALWESQAGRCYLCCSELDPRSTVVEHDHSCCGQGRSCELCRRGLACKPCNTAIGLAGDDPDRLRAMANALELAKAAVASRTAAQGEVA